MNSSEFRYELLQFRDDDWVKVKSSNHPTELQGIAVRLTNGIASDNWIIQDTHTGFSWPAYSQVQYIGNEKPLPEIPEAVLRSLWQFPTFCALFAVHILIYALLNGYESLTVIRLVFIIFSCMTGAVILSNFVPLSFLRKRYGLSRKAKQ